MRLPIFVTAFIMIAVGLVGQQTLQAQQVGKTISHQGVLLDSNGEPVEDDTYIFTISIYADSAGGSALWQVDKILDVKNGKFNAQLGTEQPLDLAFDQQYWVGIAIDGGSEMTPRLPLSAAPYAMHAYTVADSSVTTDKIANGAVTDEKLSENLNLSNHTSVGFLNFSSVEVTDSWTQLQISNDGDGSPFQKQHDLTKIKVTLHSNAFSGSFSGASWIRYQLRVDGNRGEISIPHLIYSSQTERYITLIAVFENLSAGEHNVQVWAQTGSGSSSNVLMDPGGFGGEILIEETP